MNELIPTFPRQIAYPEKITCLSESEFYTMINKINGIKQKIYFSLYECDSNGSFINTKIDKISFDLDSKKSIQVCQQISDFCVQENYRHCLIFSTGGLWIHIKTKNYENLKNPKQALKKAQHSVAKRLGLKIGHDPYKDDIDYHIIGDIARVSRMPASLDLNRGIYCISIKREDLTNVQHLKELAKKQSCEIFWYGEDTFDISKFDCELDSPVQMKDFEGKIEVDDLFLKKMPPCIQNCIMNVSLKGHNRWWVWTTIYLKELGFNVETIKSIVKPYLEKTPREDGMGKNEWQHYVKHDHLPESVFRGNYFYPKCEVLYENGFCQGKCKHYNKLYH